MMVISIVEGMVEPDKEQVLKDAYRNIVETAVPAGVVTSFLVRDEADPRTWRVITAWENQEAREILWSKGTPPAVQMFLDAGVEPSIMVLDVVDGMMAEAKVV